MPAPRRPLRLVLLSLAGLAGLAIALVLGWRLRGEMLVRELRSDSREAQLAAAAELADWRYAPARDALFEAWLASAEPAFAKALLRLDANRLCERLREHATTRTHEDLVGLARSLGTAARGEPPEDALLEPGRLPAPIWGRLYVDSFSSGSDSPMLVRRAPADVDELLGLLPRLLAIDPELRRDTERLVSSAVRAQPDAALARLEGDESAVRRAAILRGFVERALSTAMPLGVDPLPEPVRERLVDAAARELERPDGSDAETRAAAVATIRSFATATGDLERAFATPHVDARFALFSTDAVARPLPLELLRLGAQDPAATIRLAAAEAWSRRLPEGSTTLWSELGERLLLDADARVRSAALRLLATLDETSLAATEEAATPRNAGEAADPAPPATGGRLAAAAAPTLCRLLARPESLGLAAEALVHAGEGAVPSLRAVALDVEAERLARRCAVRVLERVGARDGDTVAALRRLLEDTDTTLAWLAGRALRRAESGAAGPPIVFRPRAPRQMADATWRITLEADLAEPIIGLESSWRVTPSLAATAASRSDGALESVQAFFGERGTDRRLAVGLTQLGAATLQLLGPGRALPLVTLELNARAEGEASAVLEDVRIVAADGGRSLSAVIENATVTLSTVTLSTATAPTGEEPLRGDTTRAAATVDERLRVRRQGEQARLEWSDGESSAKAWRIERDGSPLVTLPGDARSWLDPSPPARPALYRLVAEGGPHAEAWWFPSDEIYRIEAAQVVVAPGQKGARVPLLGTNSTSAQAFSIALRAAAPWARLREVVVTETASSTAEKVFFQSHVIETGVVSAGILLDMVPPDDPHLPAGSRRPIVALVLDVSEDAPRGAELEVELGHFGSPPGVNAFTVDSPRGARSATATTIDGRILVGESPAPRVEDLRLSTGEASASGRRPVALEWRPPPDALAILVERDGSSVAELPPDSTGWIDESPPPAPIVYEVRARHAETVSWPSRVIRHWDD